MAAMKPPPIGQETDVDPVLITRYPNRRLYDRSQARYITLQEIADTVRQGKTITVRDSKTGEDLTRSILTQIILEYHPERINLFPVHLLNLMIRTNEGVLAFLGNYFQQALSYVEPLEQREAVNPLLLPMYWMKALWPSPFKPGSVLPAPAEPDAAALTRRIAELERRLDELQGGQEKRGDKAAPQAKRPAGDGRQRKPFRPP
jgi:polyhydroxyalkanoate synthesis repressor PhaR